MTTGFWDAIHAQLTELRTAATANDVLRILSRERCPDEELRRDGIGDADGFFAGGGGDGTVRKSLRAAGWTTVWSEAWYYYVMQAPNGDRITYVEGDIYRGVPRWTPVDG